MAIIDDFYYEKGDLFRKLKGGVLKKTGCVDGRGYKVSGYQGKLFKTHRLIWELLRGPIPDGYQIDHIDGDKLNNHIDNLRLATHSENNCNKVKRARGNISTLPSGKFRVRIYKDKIKSFDKVFCCIDQAERARDTMLMIIHKEFYSKLQEVTYRH